MCLQSKTSLQCAQEDITCYKWVIKNITTEKKRNATFFEKLFKKDYIEVVRYYTPYVVDDVTENICCNKPMIAIGHKIARGVCLESGHSSKWVTFDELEQFQDDGIDTIEFSSGVIHAYNNINTAEECVPHRPPLDFATGYFVLYECIIPKGTLYAKGYYNDICAEKIIFVNNIKAVNIY